jgi:hypothetical protein
MSSADVDREGDTYVAYRQLSKKRGKTLEDEQRLRELEWYTRVYFDEKIGIYIPAKNLKELIREAATKYRKGEDIKRSLIVPEYRVPLIYDGPRTLEELWAMKDKDGDRRFAYTTLVSNSGAGSGRVERTRPAFDNWSIRFEVAFDPEDLNDSDVEAAVKRSEKYGLGDYRPEFGSFQASMEFVRVQREDARADGNKPRDKRAEAVSRTRAKQLTGK